jgi:hypothetical protein
MMRSCGVNVIRFSIVCWGDLSLGSHGPDFTFGSERIATPKLALIHTKREWHSED